MRGAEVKAFRIDDPKYLRCGGCGAGGCAASPLVGPLVQVGDEPDYDSSTAWLCFPCVKDAYDAMTRPTQAPSVERKP